MNKINLKCVIWKEEKFFVAQCLDVDISSFGKTKAEAKKNLNEALSLYFEETKNLKIARVEKPELITMPLCYA